MFFESVRYLFKMLQYPELNQKGWCCMLEASEEKSESVLSFNRKFGLKFNLLRSLLQVTY